MMQELFAVAEQTGISLTNIQVLADAGYWSYQNYLIMINHPFQFLCSTCHERDVFLIRGSPRSLLEIGDVCSGNYHSCQAILAACGDWCFRNLLSDGEIPTPAAITRKIMETRMEPFSMKRKYSRRKSIIEPVFGWIKENRNIRKFQRRGTNRCDNEWKLICLTQNLRTVITSGWWSKIKSAIKTTKNRAFCEGGDSFSDLMDLFLGKFSSPGYFINPNYYFC
jgi:hypothetical protein